MPDPVSDLVRLVRERLAAAADPARAEPMRAYMKSAMPCRGVTSVPLRALCRAAYDEHRLPDRDAWESAVRELWDGATYREERYAALALTRHRHYRAFQDPATLALYRHLVVSGSWWTSSTRWPATTSVTCSWRTPPHSPRCCGTGPSTTTCGCGAPR
jgi:3-methyladenine DNA glycosylase AlkD